MKESSRCCDKILETASNSATSPAVKLEEHDGRERHRAVGKDDRSFQSLVLEPSVKTAVVPV